jgi:hypothetical protein
VQYAAHQDSDDKILGAGYPVTHRFPVTLTAKLKTVTQNSSRSMITVSTRMEQARSGYITGPPRKKRSIIFYHQRVDVYGLLSFLKI